MSNEGLLVEPKPNEQIGQVIKLTGRTYRITKDYVVIDIITLTLTRLLAYPAAFV